MKTLWDKNLQLLLHILLRPAYRGNEIKHDHSTSIFFCFDLQAGQLSMSALSKIQLLLRTLCICAGMNGLATLIASER